jgi:uracil-DNA glycosylase
MANVHHDSTAATRLLADHVRRLLACRRCSAMSPPVVSGGPVMSRVMLVGQAPGEKEPLLGKPFAWTAGKTLFHWFESACGLDEAVFRASVYFAAVCRCFPGKKPEGGDRVPSPQEIQNCARWLKDEIELLQPHLIIAVGKLAIQQFMDVTTLETVVGRQFTAAYGDHQFDVIPLPHPSGASPWPRIEPGKALLRRALQLIAAHPAMRQLRP